MIKKAVAVIFVLIFAAMTGLLAACGGDLPGGAMAKVGTEVITEEEFDARLAEFEAQLGTSVPDKETDPETYKLWQDQVLDYMITYEMVQQKADELGISVTDEEIQEQIDSILNDVFSGDQEQFDEALEADGLTLDELKDYYKETLLLQKAGDAVTKDVTTVPDADISAYYEENKADYFVDETRTVRHILISPTADRPTTTTTTPSTTATTAATDDGEDATTTTTVAATTTTAPATDAEWAKALTDAEKVRATLAGGGDWTKEAADYSDDPGTKDAGGDLGVVSKGQMVPEFDEAVFSLKVDEISQPIKTVYGYHVIQVTGITEAKQYTLDEVKTEINDILVNEEKSKVWQDWVDATKAELGVIYRDDFVPSTTTTEAASESTDTTAAGDASTETTAAGEETPGQPIDETTTTAAPPETTQTTAAP